MKITPRYHSIPLAAGQEFIVADYDQFVTIFDITGATSCQWAFDDDNWETVLPGTAYELPEGKRFSRVRLRNPNPGAITVVVTFSPGRVYDNRLMNTGATLTAIAASLAAIDVDTDNLATIDADTGSILAELQGDTTHETQGTEVTLAAATAASVLASNTNRKGCVVQAKTTNAANVFIGFTNAVTDTVWVLELKPGQGYTWDDYRGAIYAYSVAGADKVGYGEW
jgi:hypothetical protein